MNFRLLLSWFWLAKSIKTKPCYTCAHYIPAMLGEKYEIGNYMGRCKKFMENQYYTYAVKARVDENMCGASGKYYENNTNSEQFANILYLAFS